MVSFPVTSPMGLRVPEITPWWKKCLRHAGPWLTIHGCGAPFLGILGMPWGLAFNPGTDPWEDCIFLPTFTMKLNQMLVKMPHTHTHGFYGWWCGLGQEFQQIGRDVWRYTMLAFAFYQCCWSICLISKQHGSVFFNTWQNSLFGTFDKMIYHLSEMLDISMKSEGLQVVSQGNGQRRWQGGRCLWLSSSSSSSSAAAASS